MNCDVYRLRREVDKHRWFELPNGGETLLDELLFQDGVIDDWATIELESPAKNNPKKLSDYPGLVSGAVPLFSEKAAGLLREPLDGIIQMLPARWEDRRFFIGKVLAVPDCLDTSRSEIEWFEGEEGKNAVEVRRHVFSVRPDSLPLVFYIPQFRGAEVYCTSAFQKLIEQTSLTGFVFRPIQ